MGHDLATTASLHIFLNSTTSVLKGGFIIPCTMYGKIYVTLSTARLKYISKYEDAYETFGEGFQTSRYPIASKIHSQPKHSHVSRY